MSVELFHRRSGSGPTLVVLHGLFGNSDNFGSIGRSLEDAFDVVLVDARDHGRSPRTDAVSYPLMAEDVHQLVTTLGLRDIILMGHSMGGKTAIHFAQRWPELLQELIVLDMGPREYGIQNHAHILEALRAIDLNVLPTRKEVEQEMMRFVPEPGVVQFLLKNLYWETPDQLAWRFNAPVIDRSMPAILAAAPPDVVRTPTLFVRGGQSDYITRADVPAIKEQFQNCRIETIEFAGHWVHAQAPDEVMALVREASGK